MKDRSLIWESARQIEFYIFLLITLYSLAATTVLVLYFFGWDIMNLNFRCMVVKTTEGSLFEIPCDILESMYASIVIPLLLFTYWTILVFLIRRRKIFQKIQIDE